MKNFELSSTSEFELKNLKIDDICIKKFKPTSGKFEHLNFPVQVIQNFLNGSLKSYYIHPGTFYSNFSKIIETDLVIDQIIDYCQITKMKIYVPKNYPEIVSLIVYYENAIYKIDELHIYVVKQMDGFNYSLPPSEFNKVVQIFQKQIAPVNNIFVPFEVKSAFEYVHGPVADHVLPALTGLNEEDFKQIRKIKFIDPRTNIVIDAK